MVNVALRLVEGAEVDKEKALEAAISQIERNCGKGSIMRLGQNEKAVEVEAISSGSLGLDIALGIGGLPRGRVVEIYGPESSGKTTLALHVVAEAQKRGGICGFIDAEHALDTVYARKLGVDLEQLLISQPDTGEQALEITDTLVRSGAIDVLVVDSVAALTPKAMSRPSEPVETTSMSSMTSPSPSRMIVPLPYCFSICASAACRALAFSVLRALTGMSMGRSPGGAAIVREGWMFVQ